MTSAISIIITNVQKIHQHFAITDASSFNRSAISAVTSLSMGLYGFRRSIKTRKMTLPTRTANHRNGATYHEILIKKECFCVCVFIVLTLTLIAGICMSCAFDDPIAINRNGSFSSSSFAVRYRTWKSLRMSLYKTEKKRNKTVRRREEKKNAMLHIFL